MKRQYKLNILLQSMLVLFLVGACLIWAYKAQASGNHNSSIILNIPDGDGDGTALALAASQHRYKVTPDLQMSVGVGYYDNSSAASLGFAASDEGILFNGSIGITDNGSVGGGVGASWKF